VNVSRIIELLLLIGVVSFVVMGRLGRRSPPRVHFALWITTLLAIGISVILTFWARTVHHL
jgi:hypothetical protein